MDDSIYLMAVNGYLSVLATCALFIFIRYIWIQRHEGYVFLRAAIALCVLWIGEMWLRIPTFYVRMMESSGAPTDFPNTTFTIGGVLVAIAFLCCIRVFSPNKWGYWSWLGSLAFSSLVVGASLLYVHIYGV